MKTLSLLTLLSATFAACQTLLCAPVTVTLAPVTITITQYPVPATVGTTTFTSNGQIITKTTTASTSLSPVTSKPALPTSTSALASVPAATQSPPSIILGTTTFTSNGQVLTRTITTSAPLTPLSQNSGFATSRRPSGSASQSTTPSRTSSYAFSFPYGNGTTTRSGSPGGATGQRTAMGSGVVLTTSRVSGTGLPTSLYRFREY